MATDRAIGAAAHEAGVSPGTLRDYERLGLMQPSRDSTGRRVYSDKDIAQARAIRQQREAARGSGLRNRAEAHPHE